MEKCFLHNRICPSFHLICSYFLLFPSPIIRAYNNEHDIWLMKTALHIQRSTYLCDLLLFINANIYCFFVEILFCFVTNKSMISETVKLSWQLPVFPRQQHQCLQKQLMLFIINDRGWKNLLWLLSFTLLTEVDEVTDLNSQVMLQNLYALYMDKHTGKPILLIKIFLTL